MEKAALIAISTPLGPFNYFSKLIQLTEEDGSAFFNVRQLGTICEACLKLPTQAEMLACTHGTNRLPPWKSGERHKRLKRITMVGDTAARGLRENAGIIASDYNTVFDTENVNRLFSLKTRPHYETIHPPDRIYITADPDGGGLSRMSIASGYVVKSNPVIPDFTLIMTGLDLKHTENHLQQKDMLEKHIAHIRGQRIFQNVPIIFIPENQTGFFHTRMEEYILTIPNAKTLYQNGGKKAGIAKTQFITSDYVICVQNMLAKDMIKWEKTWVTCSEKFVLNGREGVLNELREELLRYCYDDKNKLTGKIQGMQDDLYIAFAMLCYWSREVERPGSTNLYAPLRQFT